MLVLSFRYGYLSGTVTLRSHQDGLWQKERSEYGTLGGGMVFWRKGEEGPDAVTAPAPVAAAARGVLILGEVSPEALANSPLGTGDAQQTRITGSALSDAVLCQNTAQCAPVITSAQALVAIFQSAAALNELQSMLNAERMRRDDGLPVLVIAVRPRALAELGIWLAAAAASGQLQGVRLIVADSAGEALAQVPSRLGAFREPNFIKMPASTEVECTDFKYFYTITPDLRHVVRMMRELAENGMSRVYLLGGPGAGKTSLAYYYYLCRKKGNFVSVNLNAESTGNKEAMKSLLCGHVSGALPGAGSREGALSFAGEGVAFLDESHGVTGTVMQVLMEVLDSGQFLPFGATKKRALECAVIFASNRSWETLRDMMQLDEHARLGATIVSLTDLSVREEDLIAVLATTLARFAKQCTTWSAPAGLTHEAWTAIRACRWRGNLRTLIRVAETAFVDLCLERREPGLLIDAPQIAKGIALWEPESHASHSVYTSITSVGST